MNKSSSISQRIKQRSQSEVQPTLDRFFGPNKTNPFSQLNATNKQIQTTKQLKEAKKNRQSSPVPTLGTSFSTSHSSSSTSTTSTSAQAAPSSSSLVFSSAFSSLAAPLVTPRKSPLWQQLGLSPSSPPSTSSPTIVDQEGKRQVDILNLPRRRMYEERAGEEEAPRKRPRMRALYVEEYEDEVAERKEETEAVEEGEDCYWPPQSMSLLGVVLGGSGGGSFGVTPRRDDDEVVVFDAEEEEKAEAKERQRNREATEALPLSRQLMLAGEAIKSQNDFAFPFSLGLEEDTPTSASPSLSSPSHIPTKTSPILSAPSRGRLNLISSASSSLSSAPSLASPSLSSSSSSTLPSTSLSFPYPSSSQTFINLDQDSELDRDSGPNSSPLGSSLHLKPKSNLKALDHNPAPPSSSSSSSSSSCSVSSRKRKLAAPIIIISDSDGEEEEKKKGGELRKIFEETSSSSLIEYSTDDDIGLLELIGEMDKEEEERIEGEHEDDPVPRDICRVEEEPPEEFYFQDEEDEMMFGEGGEGDVECYTSQGLDLDDGSNWVSEDEQKEKSEDDLLLSESDFLPSRKRKSQVVTQEDQYPKVSQPELEDFSQEQDDGDEKGGSSLTSSQNIFFKPLGSFTPKNIDFFSQFSQPTTGREDSTHRRAEGGRGGGIRAGRRTGRSGGKETCSKRNVGRALPRSFTPSSTTPGSSYPCLSFSTHPAPSTASSHSTSGGPKDSGRAVPLAWSSSSSSTTAKKPWGWIKNVSGFPEGKGGRGETRGSEFSFSETRQGGRSKGSWGRGGWKGGWKTKKKKG